MHSAHLMSPGALNPLGVTDADVVKLLRMLTFLPLEEIATIEASMKQVGFAVSSDRREAHLARSAALDQHRPLLTPTIAISPQADYVPNTAQRRLAEAVTEFVHGPEGLAQAVKVRMASRAAL